MKGKKYFLQKCLIFIDFKKSGLLPTLNNNHALAETNHLAIDI